MFVIPPDRAYMNSLCHRMCVSPEQHHSELGTYQHVFKQQVFVASPFSVKIFLSRWWDWRCFMKTSDAEEVLPVGNTKKLLL